MAKEVMQKSYVLTVSESKRLIARGIAHWQVIQGALQDGIVAIAKGTTDGYVAEEITGETINKHHYCTGTTQPASGGGEADIANELDDVVLRNGTMWDGMSATEAVEEMSAGDIFIKGANALNYERGQAGILIGHPTGGTIGAAIGTLIARRAKLLLPVGLEKSIPGDLYEISNNLNWPAENGSGPVLWPVEGEVFTELEALQILAGVEARPIAAGGILGAEGSVRIAVWGDSGEMDQTEQVIEEVRGEPTFEDA